ncbi:hypothetical protein ATANTOWER_003875 [Ataeniobius toweri]|uniref:Uncharacterized protein n=1 Tax=Ataeniobius toweri TaxID=208326 RepID=A0ABU7CI75_9TELE|nr:hypothetical protein [Ataeniobius toweri]
MKMPPLISKNYSPHKARHAPSAPCRPASDTQNQIKHRGHNLCAAAPRLWNALPDTLRAPQSMYILSLYRAMVPPVLWNHLHQACLNSKFTVFFSPLDPVY